MLPEAGADDQVAADPGGFEAWLRKRVAEEAGYDRIVREILTTKLARGDERPAGRTEPSPAAYFTSRGGKPETIAADAARVFLGVRLECAQCHNHPFAKWRREEFWGFAAFFAGVPAPNQDGGAP